ILDGSSIVIDQLLAPEVDQRLCLVVSHKSGLDALRASSIGWQIEHIAPAQQALSAAHIDNGARVYSRGYHKGDTCRDVGFDQAGNDIHRWTLRSDHQVDAGGTR